MQAATTVFGGYRSIRPGSIRSTSAPNAVVPPQFLERSAPSSGSFRPNTHRPKYKLFRNKFFHIAHRRWLVTTVYGIQSLIDQHDSHLFRSIACTVYTICSQSNAIVQWIAGIADTNTHVATSERPSLKMPLSREKTTTHIVKTAVFSDVCCLLTYIYLDLDPPHVRVTTPYSGKCFECDFDKPIARCLSTIELGC